MSIIINNIRIAFDDDDKTAIKKAIRQYNLPAAECGAFIYRSSIDARRGKISKVISVEVNFSDLNTERKIVDKINSPYVKLKIQAEKIQIIGNKKIHKRPVVIGFGPAGMFAALTLSEYGYNPIVIERGADIDKRNKFVDNFMNTGKLNLSSNIQFGEGGAGAYSDGKLTTRINDPLCEYVLDCFVKAGAPDYIKRMAKPHIGTDILKNIVKNIRKSIISNGGQVEFERKLTGFKIKNGKLAAIVTDDGEIETETAVLAIGHSARDTFEMLKNSGLEMQSKPFAVGVRIEHLQENIDRGLYGKFAGHKALPKGEYALAGKTSDGRGCYTFCMCPGGYVVPAASEENSLAVNGMSYNSRNGKNANSAVVVAVNREDFESDDPLAGVCFQQRIERLAYNASNSFRAPVQLSGDFLNGVKSSRFGSIKPTYSIGTSFESFDEILPQFICGGIREAIIQFGKKIRGFDCDDAVLTAPETRTSSPVRILRGDNMFSSTEGIIPCGEGAGYAGGITSAAVDGVKAAREIMRLYIPD